MFLVNLEQEGHDHLRGRHRSVRAIFYAKADI
jgi:hypothetical protein